ALGDQRNDEQMLRWSGTCYALESGHSGILTQADVTAPSCDDDGVGEMIEHLMTLPEMVVYVGKSCRLSACKIRGHVCVLRCRELFWKRARANVFGRHVSYGTGQFCDPPGIESTIGSNIRGQSIGDGLQLCRIAGI